MLASGLMLFRVAKLALTSGLANDVPAIPLAYRVDPFALLQLAVRIDDPGAMISRLEPYELKEARLPLVSSAPTATTSG